MSYIMTLRGWKQLEPKEAKAPLPPSSDLPPWHVHYDRSNDPQFKGNK